MTLTITSTQITHDLIPIVPKIPIIPTAQLSLFQSETSSSRAALPNFLSEGVRFGSDTKNGGWDILSVFPIRHFD